MCLSDPYSIREGLETKKEDIWSIEGAIVDDLTDGDQVRRQTFMQVGFYQKNMILSQDFNFKTSVERGLDQNAIKSVKMLIRQIFEKINTFEYGHLIMMDLPYILASKKLLINEFFERSFAEMQNKRSGDGFCNMEVPFSSHELPVFSDVALEHFVCKDFDNFHNY